MTAHPIDTEALAKRAGHTLFTAGPEQPAATARETCVLLDLLAAAEHRATRAGAQADVRGRAVAIYQQRAREAEAQNKAWAQQYDYDMGQEVSRAEEAEARIKAVRDALDDHGKPTDRIGGLPDAIRRALDGDA